MTYGTVGKVDAMEDHHPGERAGRFKFGFVGFVFGAIFGVMGNMAMAPGVAATGSTTYLMTGECDGYYFECSCGVPSGGGDALQHTALGCRGEAGSCTCPGS